MLSYQHAFHAGNHADVLKHITLIAILQKLNQKAKPYFVLDTHAGAGMYDLSNAPSKADATAFDQLLNAFERCDGQGSQSAALSDYVKLIKQLYAKSIYPGSPMLLSSFAREQDNVHANELSAVMFAELEDNLSVKVGFGVSGTKVQVHQRDAFELIKAMTPPKPNRGAILIDPPYERASEYNDVLKGIKDVFKRWQQAQIVVWYPLLSARAGAKHGASERMLEQLTELGRPCFKAEICIAENEHDAGMYGSGVLVLNPPWQLDQQLSSALLEAVEHMGPVALTNLTWLNKDA